MVILSNVNKFHDNHKESIKLQITNSCRNIKRPVQGTFMITALTHFRETEASANYTMHSNKNGTINSNGYYNKAENVFQPSSASPQTSSSLPSHTSVQIPLIQTEPDVRYTKVSTTKEPPGNVEAEIRGQKWSKFSEAVTFLSVPSNGENCLPDLSIKKDNRTKFEKCAFYSGFVGLTFILSAIVW